MRYHAKIVHPSVHICFKILGNKINNFFTPKTDRIIQLHPQKYPSVYTTSSTADSIPIKKSLINFMQLNNGC